MGRRESVVAVVVAALCVASVLCRGIPPPSAAHTPKDAHGKNRKGLGLREGRPKGGKAVERLKQVDAADQWSKKELASMTGAQRLLPEDLQDPELTPGLFQGDMAGLTPGVELMDTRVSVKWEKFPDRRWTNATVPYVISYLYGANERQMILVALATIEFLTCIKFVPWDEKEKDYLLIWPIERPAGCWSFVGKQGGQQILSLQAPDLRSKRCFVSLGKPIHELLHALGFFHEQSRPDRDDYIDIILENIPPQYHSNFKKQSAENTTFPYTYDYDSVMHYGNNFYSFFSTDPTIIPKKEGVTIGQRIMLSQLDCLKLNDVYGCLDDPFDKLKYTSFCRYLGL